MVLPLKNQTHTFQGDVFHLLSLSSDGEVQLLSPVHPVMKGDSVTLQCKVKLYELNQIIFYKNGIQVLSLNGTQMTIENVTKADEGFYKCAIANSTLESPENRLWVRGARSEWSLRVCNFMF